MSACPTCGKDVDALRARNVKVRGIQVVAYCSPECLAAADSMPNPAPVKAVTPAQGVVKQGVAPDSGPVIEIRYEPASGVVTSAKDERKTPPPGALAAEAKAVTPASTKDDKPEPKPDPKSESKKDDKKKKPLAVVDEPKPDKKPEPDLKPSAKPTDDAGAKTGATKDNERRPVLKIIDEAGATPRDIQAPKPAGSGEPGPGPKQGRPGGSDPAKLSPAKLSEIEPGRRRLGRETLERDHNNMAQAEDWLDDEPAAARAETDLTGDPPAKAGGGAKRALMILIVLGLVGAAVLLAYKLLYLDRSGAAAIKPGSGSVGVTGSGSGSGSQRVVGPPVGSGSGSQQAEAESAEHIRAKALGVLQSYLKDNSLRVQRVAAAALARTGDRAARDRLFAALDRKSVDKLEESARLEVAYHLARVGDKRGLDVIVASLTAPRRDDKLIAGRLLVQLGDVRAVNTLAAYLEVPQHRLSAAEWLARLGEPRAIKVLEQVRADATATSDDKNRALIGLAFAGKPGLAEELRTLLSNTHFNAFAAEALAQKHDEAARPVLVQQLAVSSLRVAAARALRMLSPDGDHMPHVRVLAAALVDPTKQRDTELIPIAEAILILLGPAGWSERA